MAGFDPDAYLAKKTAAVATQDQGAAPSTGFDPDAYLAKKGAPATLPHDQTPAEYALDLIAGPAKKFASVVTAPFAGLDKVTGAPPRAAVGALQRGEGLGAAGSAFVDQLKAGLPSIENGALKSGEILPTTPTGAEIGYQGAVQAGIQPDFAKTIAGPAGVAADAALDVTNFIPGDMMASGAKMAGEGLEGAARAASKVAGKAEMALATGIARTGQVMTQGTLKAEKALQMYKDLSAMDMLLPGTMDFGKMQKQAELVGGLRNAFRENAITVPGSHDIAQQVSALVDQAEYRSGRTPGSERLRQMIQDRAFEKQIVTDPPRIDIKTDSFGAQVQVPVPAQTREVVTPRDLTLDEMDDLVREADDLGFTPIGNPRSQPAKWAPTIRQSRALLDDAMQTIPEGQMFKEQKQQFAGLATAGTHRSKLVEVTSNVATLAAGSLTLNPAALLLQAARPQAYVNLLGLLKIPSDAAEVLKASYASGSLASMRDALTQIATKYPQTTEKLIRATALLSGKPSGQQFLTPEEAGSLQDIRIFDPNQISDEKNRIQSDPSMSNIDKAKQLNEINKNGYIRIQKPAGPKNEETSGIKPSPVLPQTLEGIKGAMQRASH